MHSLIWFIAGTSVIASAATHYFSGHAGWSIGAGLAVFVALPTLLLKHFSRIHRLRHKEGDVQRALIEFALWRPLLSRREYVILRSEMLIQAGLFDSVAHLIEDRSLSPEQREHARFILYQAQEQWTQAEQALRLSLASATGPLRTAQLVELACLIAERFPDRMEEACELYDKALKLPTLKGMESILLSLEGLLFTLGGQPEPGRQIFEEFLTEIEERAAQDCSLLPVLAEMRKNVARARWANGDDSGAQELLSRALHTYRGSPRWTREVERDLARLREGEPLLGPVSDTVRDLFARRAEEFELRREWPGGTQATM